MSMTTESAADKQAQSRSDRAAAEASVLTSNRPVLHHLNADSSWLLSLPYPPHARRPPGRHRFNIILDVWLQGYQVDYFRWFSSQHHAIPSSFQSIKDVNEWLRQAENVTDSSTPDESCATSTSTNFIDAVFCSHEFTDHCHEATMREIASNVPVYAPNKAASLIKSWKYFENVCEIPVLQSGFDWQSTSLPRLPNWIGVARIHTKNDAPAYLHSALAIFFSLDTSQAVETILYTPHGVAATSMELVMTGKPPVKPLALIHGLHDISLLSSQLNLGMDNALEIQKFLRAPYWLRTHDEVKVAKGIVASFLNRVEHTLPFAPGSHPITTESDVNETPALISDRSFIEVGNGQSLVLK